MKKNTWIILFTVLVVLGYILWQLPSYTKAFKLFRDWDRLNAEIAKTYTPYNNKSSTGYTVERVIDGKQLKARREWYTKADEMLTDSVKVDVV